MEKEKIKKLALFCVLMESGEEILYDIENYGDYGIGWLIQLDNQGKEIARFNTRQIDGIKWK